MKKTKYKYFVVINWSEEDKAYVAEVPELPGCATHGRTYEEAAKRAQEAIISWLEGAKEASYPIPKPLAKKSFTGKFITRIAPTLHKVLVIKAKQMGTSLNSLVEDLLRKAVV